MTGIVRTTGIRTQRVLQLDLLVNLIQIYQINTMILIYLIHFLNILTLLSYLVGFRYFRSLAFSHANYL